MSDSFQKPFQGEPMQTPTITEKVNLVREMFLAAADEVYKQSGIRVGCTIEQPSDAAYYDAEPTNDEPTRQPRFNIGDVVILNSGGAAMNVSNVNLQHPVVECVWMDECGGFNCEVLPESCLRLYQEGSN